MKHRLNAASLGALSLVIAMAWFSSSTIAGQAPSAGARASAPAATDYVAPRTPDGHPDLQGIWANNDATPLERPKELEGRALLTDAEVAALKRRAAELFNGETDAAFGDSVYLAVLKDAKEFKSTDTQTGNYNHFWIVDREFDNRTSVVSDPPDGKIPELTPEAKQKVAAAEEYRRLHPADGPEDLPLSHRCVSFGVPRLRAGYNSYFQIVQTRNEVAIGQEMIHDVRVIPVDGRPHINASVRLWHGDPRGRWEGDTLVVETTNFSDKSIFENRPTGENLRVVERFTRIGPKTLQWDVTFNDPSTWTKPWTATVLLRSTTDPIFEMACQEGNEGKGGALSGNRVLELQKEAAKKGSR